jgi:hypothetical protein
MLRTFCMLLLCSYFADDIFKFMETIVLVHLLFIYESVLVKDIGVVLD